MTQVHESPGRDASEPGHPCLRCGACCAVYRVAFHWLEVADVDGVPEELTQPLDPHRLEMRKLSDGRCVALSGTIGQEARCTMYGRRPSVCRELTPAWEDGRASPQCDRARAWFGLPPLTPADWEVPPAVTTTASESGFRM